jgi:D-glycero-D-manno-heptose 1,7-bisphosphate phosphatase
VARLGGEPLGRRPALLLDRDGTLLEPIEYLGDPGRVRLLPGVGAALRRAAAAGYELVVVTNQSAVARRLFGQAEVDAVHAATAQALAEHGVRIRRFYTCPHHPDHGGPCACRKPEPGMLRQAALELELDLRRSAMVGDTLEDLLAGERAGCRTFLVRTGYGARVAAQQQAAFPPGAQVVADLEAAVARLLAAGPGAP